MTRSRWLPIVVGAVIVCAAPAHAWTVTPPRAGQVGLGMQYQYGTLLASGAMGESFEMGDGLAVRLRYRMRYERAIGLSFEGQSFDARDLNSDSTSASIFTAGLDFYRMFGTRTRTSKMLSIGAGLAKVSVKLDDGDTLYPFADGLYVSLGMGVEHFFYRSMAYDLSGRYLATFIDGSTNHDLQASIGLIFYASY